MVGSKGFYKTIVYDGKALSQPWLAHYQTVVVMPQGDSDECDFRAYVNMNGSRITYFAIHEGWNQM